MKTSKVVIILLVILIILIIFSIYRLNKKGTIVANAVSLGIPPEIAVNAANSSNPERSFRSLGVPSNIANLIVTSSNVQNAEIYQCKWTDPKSGAVTIKDGPCTTTDANNGWVTSSK